MATYKLIQDIEAEDHILGPLSFRQFVFGLITAFMGYLCFLVIVKHVPFLLVILLPPTLFCGFFAFPWGGDQPTETWALGKLHFWFKPRRRVWNQSGLKELVTITVPKKVERAYTDGLSQREVKSRLQALANTIDSRGWAIKHINAVGYVTDQGNSDRLINIPSVPAPTGEGAEEAGDDIMDADTNPIAHQFDDMITKSSQDRRQRLMEELRKPLTPEPAPVPATAASPAMPAMTSGPPVVTAAAPMPQWFMNHNPVPAVPAGPTITGPTVMAAQPSADDSALSDALKARIEQQSARDQETYSNLRTLQPLSAAPAQPAPATPVQNVPQPAADGGAGPMTASSDPAILSLSNNNDLNVATIAREAQRAKEGTQDEVVISLH